MRDKSLLKYRTFGDVMTEVRRDFRIYDQNGMIDDADYIGVVKRINKSLGNKLNQDKETMLYVEKNKVRLPDDFHKVNAAFMCYNYTLTNKIIQGDQREYREVVSTIVPDGCDVPCDEVCNPCNPCVRLNQCGKEYEIIETTAFETRRYTDFGRLKITSTYALMPECINYQFNCVDTAYIKDKFLYTSFPEGKIYLSYVGQMEDDDGNLLVLDHDLVNDYYEYACKRRLLENLAIAKEDVVQSINLIEPKYKIAKVEAESLINMPDFAEMDEYHVANRQAAYAKYYYIFK